MATVVISLKKHMDAYGEEMARSAVSAYRAVLTAMAKAGARAMPQLGAGLLQKLNPLQEKLAGSVTPGELGGIQESVERELAQWGDSAAQYSRDKAKEIKEIMVAVAATAAAVGERDQRYSSQFSGLTTRLHSIAKLEDLTRIRRSVVASATELKSAVEKMAEEGEQSISKLRAEVENYRSKLEQSEKREMVDPLTGLANRRGIEAQVEDLMSWRRPFCLAIMDLNGFKWINDLHGHVAGDDLLKQFAAEIKAHLRPTDLVGRWGGDEFVIVVASSLEEAQICLDRVRQWTFGDYQISNGRDTIEVNLHASIGIAAWDEKESAVELLARADERMYTEKKANGKPRTIVA